MMEKDSLTNLSRACVFIDSSNPSMPYQVIDSKVRPLIKLPFPPVIDPIDLVVQQSNGDSIPARAPNAFIIYRKVFIDAAHGDGYHLPMRIMSSMASQSWEQESDEVKSEYRRLANEVFNIRNEMYPKSGCKRKRAKWNIVSFKNKTKETKKRQKWNIISFDSKKSESPQKKSVETKKIVEKQTKLEDIQQVQQTPSPPSLSPESYDKDDAFSSNFKNISPYPEMNFDVSNDVNNVNDVNELTPNDAFNQDFAYQNMNSSPDLSIHSNLSPELTDPQIEYDLDFCYPAQPLDGIYDGQFNFQNLQQIKNENLFNCYQGLEFDGNPTFVCDNNESVPSPEYFINYQPDNIESDVYYYNMNYFPDELGITNYSGVEFTM